MKFPWCLVAYLAILISDFVKYLALIFHLEVNLYYYVETFTNYHQFGISVNLA